MWDFLSTGAGTPSGAGDIREAAGLSDLVAVGRFIGVERGDAVGAAGEDAGWYAVALIDVDSTQKGKAATGPDGLVRVPFLLVLGGSVYPEKEFADLQASLPKDPALLFLTTWASYFDRSGTDVPTWLAGLDRSDIYRTIGADGAVRVVDGLLKPSPYAETWVTTLKGETLVDAVRDLRTN